MSLGFGRLDESPSLSQIIRRPMLTAKTHPPPGGPLGPGFQGSVRLIPTCPGAMLCKLGPLKVSRCLNKLGSRDERPQINLLRSSRATLLICRNAMEVENGEKCFGTLGGGVGVLRA
ncbi:hypothetical protein VTI74DRAFT_730 [Chaetomium olivicolor]